MIADLARVPVDQRRVLPAYQKLSGLGGFRANKFLTFDTCQVPPRAVRTPRSLRACAMPR